MHDTPLTANRVTSVGRRPQYCIIGTHNAYPGISTSADRMNVKYGLPGKSDVFCDRP